MKTIGHFIDGKRVAGTSGRTKDIFNPNTGEVQAKVSMATPAELDAAVASAAEAQRIWANTNPQRRSRILFAYKQLVDANMDDLAAMLSSEHGKVLADSRGDVMRGVDVIEFACGVPHGQKGEHTYGAGPEIDVYSMRKPLGVVAGITPFNFPALMAISKSLMQYAITQRSEPFPLLALLTLRNMSILVPRRRGNGRNVWAERRTTALLCRTPIWTKPSKIFWARPLARRGNAVWRYPLLFPSVRVLRSASWRKCCRPLRR